MTPQDTAELRVRMERVAADVLAQQQKAQQAQARKKSNEDDDPNWLLKRLRTAFWFVGTTSAVIGGVFSIMQWADKLTFATGVISWLSIGLPVFALASAVSVHVTIGRRQSKAENDRVVFAINTGAAMLREEVRDARPADAVALGELATEVQANRSLIAQLLDAVSHNERQRQADFDAIRDNSRKLLESMHDQIERHDDEMYRGMALITENQIAIHAVLMRVSERLATAVAGQGLDPTDPKYLADMSECVRLGEEIATRKLRPPEQPIPN